ncbi:hypothetical protein [Maribacter halichondriae]|uniref:hypothetical protein n=1 Tax=Maribacter halichondriae TaxID=2980554 RepID=UPI0023591853|nr:hypothetical protein [Maribacter sp. Hal144]
MNDKLKIMKKIKIYMTSLILGSLAWSCSETKLIDDVFEETDRGLVLRTVASLGDNYNISDTSSVWGVTLEVQDKENGALLSDVKVFVSFVDTTVEDGGTDFSTAETEIGTFSAANFSNIGPFGFPRGDISYSYAEAIAATGVDFDNIDGGDTFNYRLEANLTNGRTYTNNANGTVTGGSFFSSPFAYVSPVVCPPTPPTAGSWSIEMQDSFGDGLNDAALVITLDGTATTFTFDDGFSGSFTLDVPIGTEVMSIVFTSGAFDEEVTFQVTSANGTEILDLGPSPSAGVELLDYCLGDIL